MPSGEEVDEAIVRNKKKKSLSFLLRLVVKAHVRHSVMFLSSISYFFVFLALWLLLWAGVKEWREKGKLEKKQKEDSGLIYLSLSPLLRLRTH